MFNKEDKMKISLSNGIIISTSVMFNYSITKKKKKRNKTG